MLIEQVHWLGHSSFRVEAANGFNIYFDPFQLKAGLPMAGLVLVTHDHYDHFSPDDINKILGPDTAVLGSACVAAKLGGPARVMTPGGTAEISGVRINAVPAYNINKKFHPLAAGNLGFVVKIGMEAIYHAGDTDLIPEMAAIKTDIALLPVGGTYTMNAAEAAQAAGIINPKIAVPMHYGKSVGTAADALEFKKLCKVNTKIFIQE